jgi:hypothetical protein
LGKKGLHNYQFSQTEGLPQKTTLSAIPAAVTAFRPTSGARRPPKTPHPTPCHPGSFYIFTIIVKATHQNIIPRMTLTFLPFLFSASYMFTTFAYVTRQRGGALRKDGATPALLLSLPLRQSGPTAPLTAMWASVVNFVSHLQRARA